MSRSVAGDGIPGVVDGLVRATETDVIGRDAAPAIRDKTLDDLAVQEAPGRHAVHEQGNRTVAGAYVHIVQPKALKRQIVRRVVEVGETRERTFRRPQKRQSRVCGEHFIPSRRPGSR